MAKPNLAFRTLLPMVAALLVAATAVVLGGWVLWGLAGITCYFVIVAAPQYAISNGDSEEYPNKGVSRWRSAAISCGPGSTITAALMVATFDSILPTGLLASDPSRYEGLLVLAAIATLASHGFSVLALIVSINKQIIDSDQQDPLTVLGLLYYAVLVVGFVGLNLLAMVFMGPM